MAGKVDFKVIGDSINGQNIRYIGTKNDISISNYNAHLNTYFNIDIQQSAYFTMLIEGFEYNRFHTSIKSTTKRFEDGRRDVFFNTGASAFGAGETLRTTNFESFNMNGSAFWIPLKSLQYSQGSIENMSIAVGAFADIQLPYRKHAPTLTVEMYDHRSEFFEMKLREWHSQSVITQGFVPVLESITKKVILRGFATNGEQNYQQECQCILGDDISTSRNYEDNALKVISFKLVIVGY